VAYSVALDHVLSSKSVAYQLAGIGRRVTVGLAVLPPTGPWKNDFAFQVAFVTVPSPSFRMKPPSPILLVYSMPVFGSALSLARTAIVSGYSGRILIEIWLCGRKSMALTATIFPLMKIAHQLSA